MKAFKGLLNALWMSAIIWLLVALMMLSGCAMPKRYDEPINIILDAIYIITPVDGLFPGIYIEGNKDDAEDKNDSKPRP